MAVAVLGASSAASAQVERIWLTHRSNDTSRLVVNWTTRASGDSTVRFGPTNAYGLEVRVAEDVKLHHVEFLLPVKAVEVHYSVRTGEQASGDEVFKGYPTDVLRVAVVADWQSKPDLK